MKIEDRGDNLEDVKDDVVEEEVKANVDTDGEDEDSEELVEDEDTDGEEEDTEEGSKEKEPMLPKSRYDSIKAKNKALQERLAKFDAEAKAKEDKAIASDINTKQARIDELDDEINDALLDSDKALAKRLRKEQRTLEAEILQAEFDKKTRVITDEARESIRLDMTLDSIEEAFPSLNPDDPENYSQELVDLVKELRDGFMGTGKYSPTDALLTAVNHILGDPAATIVDKPVKNVSRRKTAVKKAVDAANRQAPNTSGIGNDGDSGGISEIPNANRLTDADLDSLPLETLKRMRGDSL